MSEIDYTPTDVARHPLFCNDDNGQVLQPYLLDRWWVNGFDTVYVGVVIADTCAVGAGGHYGEVLEDCQEGEIMSALAEFLAPLYAKNDREEMYLLLTNVRDEWCSRLQDSAEGLLKTWTDEGFDVDMTERET